MWAADESQLWKPSVYPELPDEAAALDKANELASQQGLLPKLEGPFQFGKPIVGGTYFSLTQEDKRVDRRLDVQVIYPLQVGDFRLVGGGGDVFNRWEGAFDGMHILMGYGAVTRDNTDEGRKLSQYAKGGSTLISDWFRTAREIQQATSDEVAPDGPIIWVGAMWVGKGAIDPVNDYAWDFGSVSADPTSPTWTLPCGRLANPIPIQIQ